jgi:hypothetical protein
LLPLNVVPTESDVRLTLDVELRGQLYVLSITRTSFKLMRKGRRWSVELPWTAFLDEDAVMLSALHASIRRRLRNRK